MREDGLPVPGLGICRIEPSHLACWSPRSGCQFNLARVDDGDHLVTRRTRTAVAGFSVASRVETSFAMLYGHSVWCIAPIIGQNWGAGRFDRVASALKTAYWFALGWGSFAYCPSLLDWLTWISDDPEVVVAATAHLSILPIGMGLMGVIAIATSSFNALGRPNPPLMISSFRCSACRYRLL